MENKTLKTLAITALVVAVGGLTLGYAALTQSLSINTSAKVQNSATSWKIKFNNPSAGAITGDAVKGSINVTDTDVTVSDIVLKAPGDSVTYTFDVVNSGQIDAELTTFTLKNPTVTGTGGTKDADEALVNGKYTYTLTYTDGGAPVAQGDTLDAGATKNITLKIVFDAGVEQLPTADVTISDLGASLIYTQK